MRAVYAAASDLVDRARPGDGPAFLLCNTYRYHGHHVGDINRAYYRSKEEEQTWKTSRDPLTLFGEWLTALRAWRRPPPWTRSGRATRRRIDAAVQFAIDAPYPVAADVRQHVYA